MKKTAYLAPEMKTFELDMEQTIAYSGGSQATADEPPVVVDPNPDSDPDPNRSRGFGW
jgi:hypothetical protein